MSALCFYNEIDQKAAAWLRELIAGGHIAPGVVDERSITEINPYELNDYVQCHFFAGIGGWSYALRLAGWPDERPVWTGSCPCQPLSCAGRRQGHADERHLWPAFYRLIAECRPATVFGEQVASKDGREWLAGIRADLEGSGYAVGAADLCAAGVGAPHIRQRLFWVGVSEGKRWDWRADGQNGRGRKCASRYSGARGNCRLGDADVAGSQERGLRPDGFTGEEGREAAERSAGLSGVSRGVGDSEQRRCRWDSRGRTIGKPENTNAWAAFTLIPCADGKARRIESGSFPLAHGIPGRVGLLRGYGNAIVPQVAAEFVMAFCEAVGAESPAELPENGNVHLLSHE